MRLYFLLARRVPPVLGPVLSEVIRLLQLRGFTVESGIAEELVTRLDDLDVRHDLYILKSNTELALSLAGVLAARGACLLNPYHSCVVTQNKIVASGRLRAAGVPTPETWVTGDVTLLRDVATTRALILKPYLGRRGAGLRVVRDPDDLVGLAPLESPVLVQDYIEGSGEDLKLYCIGDDVFAVRKPFSPSSFAVPGRPCPVSPEVRDIARRCGAVLGLGLYGVDIVESARGPWVVDVNTFPGYKGVPDIAPRIVDYIAAAAERAARGEPIVAAEPPVASFLIAARAFPSSALKLVLNGLCTAPTTPRELDEIRGLLEQLRQVVDGRRTAASARRSARARS